MRGPAHLELGKQSLCSLVDPGDANKIGVSHLPEEARPFAGIGDPLHAYSAQHRPEAWLSQADFHMWAGLPQRHCISISRQDAGRSTC